MNISKPLTDKQLKEGDLIPKGVYNFQVMNAEESISKAGNDMIKILVKIWMDDGRERTIYDYLLESMEFKLGHFAEVTGLLDQYKNNKLNAQDCIGKTGSLKIGIQSDKNGEYPDKNSIIDYITTPKSSMSHPAAMKPLPVVKDDLDGDIPF